MKIDNSRIFTADIYQVTNSRAEETTFMFGDVADVSFGSYDYDEELIDKDAIVVYFKNRNCYVPVSELKRVSDYVSIRFGSGYNDERTLFDDPGFMPRNGKRFVKNMRQLFNGMPGRTNVEDLIKMQFKSEEPYEVQMLEGDDDENSIEFSEDLMFAEDIDMGDIDIEK